MGPQYDRVYVGDLGLAQDTPLKVSINLTSQDKQEPWQPIHNVVNERNGYIDLPGTPAGYKLRIEGYGYLDFRVAGVPSTSWTATLAIDDPQTKIVSAKAAQYLYQTMMQPNMVSGDTQAYATGYQFWTDEYEKRKDQFHMPFIPIKINWGQR
jgi:hypothetical protein